MVGGALLLILFGMTVSLAVAAVVLVGLAAFFRWLLKTSRSAVTSAGPGPAKAAPRRAPSAPQTAMRHQPAPPSEPAALRNRNPSAASTHSFTGVATALAVIAAALIVPFSFSRVQTAPEAVNLRVRNSRMVEPNADSPDSPAISARTPESPVTPESDTAGQASAPAGTDALPRTPAERRRLLADFAAQVGRLFSGGGSGVDQPASAPGSGPVSLGESRNGEVVVFELTQPMVRQLLGDAAGDLLRDMQSRLPGDIREGYALIPLGSSLGTALPPVPPRLAASGLSSLADSLVSILSPESPDSSTVVPATPRPDWVEAPPAGSRVVRITRVGDNPVDADRAAQLTAAARQLLLEQATAENLPHEYHAVISSLPIDSSEFVLTPPWTETEEADLGSASGKQPVTTEFHLVSLPPDLEVRQMAEVGNRVRSLRTVGVATCVGTFWLGLLALTVCSRPLSAGGQSGRWLIISGGAAAVVLLGITMLLGTLLFSGQLGEQAPALVSYLGQF